MKAAHKETAEVPLAARISSAWTRPKRVLLVEDEDVFTRFFSGFVTTNFLTDLTTATSVEGARSALASTDKFDAIVLDVRLVNGDGVDLYREIESRWPSVEVIFITGFDSPELRNKIEQIGPARVYSKCALTADFLRALFTQIGCRPRLAVASASALGS